MGLASGFGPGWYRTLHRSLRLRFALFLLFLPVPVGAVAHALISGGAPFVLVTLVPPGLSLGYVLGRLTRVAWDPKACQVVLVGSQVLVIAASISLRLSLRLWLGEQLAGLSFAGDAVQLFSAGWSAGYALGLLKEVRNALAGREKV